MAYQREIEKLEQRFREKPEQWFAALADAYRKSGELDMALEILKAWIEKRPNYTSGHIVHGRVLLDMGQLRDAAAVFERVLGLDPENIIAIKSLGEIAELQGDAFTAKGWLNRLLEVDPMNDEAREALARLDQAPPAAVAESPAAAEAAPTPEPAAPEAPGVWLDAESVTPAIEAASAEAPATSSDDTEQPLAIGGPEEAGPPEEPPVPPEHGFVIERASHGHLTFEPTPEAVPAAEETPEPIPMLELEPVELPAASSPESAEPPLIEAAASAEDEVAPEVGDLESFEFEPVEPPAEPPAPDASDLGITSFDEELAWDAGERTSRQITAEDMELAEHAHDDALDAVAHALPGLESEDVPASEGPPLVEPPDAAEVLEEEARSWETPEIEERLAPPPVAEQSPITPDLPLIMPEDVTPVEVVEDALETARLGEDQPIAGEFELVAAEPPGPAGAPAVPEAPEVSDAATVSTTHEPEEAPELEPVVTETMAELYARQGHVMQAREIYRRLVEEQPSETRFAARLRELDTEAAPRGGHRPLPRFSVVATGGVSARAMLERLAAARPEVPFTPAPAPVATTDSAIQEEPSEARDDEHPTGSEPAEGPEGPGGSLEAGEPAPTAAPQRPSFSFDEFFGGTGPAPDGARPSVDDMDDDDFRSWLQGLKT